MSQTKNQQSRQDMQHGHQNEMPKKGQNPNDHRTNMPSRNTRKSRA